MIVALLITVRFYKKTVPDLSPPHRYLLLALRFVAITILLILLFNPILRLAGRVERRSEIVFLIDNSDSMDLLENETSKSKLLESYQSELEAKTKDYELSTYYFADGIDGNTSTTKLSKTLEDLTREKILADITAVYLFSDGWFKDEQFKTVENFPIPISPVLPDFEVTDFDLEVSDIRVSRTVHENEITPIGVNVHATDFDEDAILTFRVGDEVIQQREVDFSEAQHKQVIFEHEFTETGLKSISFEIESESYDEVFLGNNRLSTAVQVLSDRKSILLITDIPNWDSAFIMRALNRNPRWQPHFYTYQDQSLFNGQNEVEFSEAISEATVLVFVTIDNINFSAEQVEMIEQFLRLGGGILSQGKPIESIEQFLPAQQSNISGKFQAPLYLTEESQKYETFQRIESVRSIPPVKYYYTVPSVDAEILARLENEQNSPAILFSNYYEGRVLSLGFLEFWRWQLHSEADRYYSLISDIVSWLGQKATDRFFAESDRSQYYEGESVSIRLSAYDERLLPQKGLTVHLTVTEEEEETAHQSLMREYGDEYRAEIADLQAGNYTFTAIEERTGRQAEGEFMVSDMNPEYRDRGFNPALLYYIANQTGGNVLTSDNFESFALDEPEIHTDRVLREIPIYRKWYIIALFLLCFCSELFLRKRWGLL